jgi:hypothetical protein
MKTIRNIFLFVAGVAFFCGCSLFGLDLQTDYDYEQSFYDNKLYMNAWEFIESRPDLFSGMIEAVNYVESIEPSIREMYKQPGNTYILMTNSGLSSTTSTNSYFYMNRLQDGSEYLIPSVWEAYPKEQVLRLLKYHVVKGEWGTEELPTAPTWYDTWASDGTAADTAKMNLYLSNDRYGRMYVNNYAGVPSITIPGTTTTVAYVNLYPRTPNLRATNGVIHVFNRWFFPPRKAVLGL